MDNPDQEELKQLLERGVEEVIDQRRVTQLLRRGKPLRIKYGIDPTGHSIHLGHAVPLRKLREWQGLGHQAVIIIGDYTAQIGDPSGRDKQRQALTQETVERFARTYTDQVGQIIDTSKAEIRFNSEWYETFSQADLFKLIRQATVQQLLAHETFRTRMRADKPVNVLELMYPLLQGYDSVAVQADVELGGADQKFNLLMGREIQTAYGQQPQGVMLMPYLAGLDGKQKMSKTADNTIAIQDEPNEKYGKVMSLPDKVMLEYFELATTVPLEELNDLKKQFRKKDTNKRDLKARLAREIVKLYDGEKAAEVAELEFTNVHRKKQQPSTFPSITVRAGKHPLINLLVGHQLAPNRSAARRLIEQGGVRVNKEAIKDWEAEITVEDGTVLQIGKRRFVKIVTSS